MNNGSERRFFLAMSSTITITPGLMVKVNSDGGAKTCHIHCKEHHPRKKECAKGPLLEISQCNRDVMPFCRECGKEVQEDWVTCPYCSKSIGPPASRMINQLNDSVVGRDVITNISNDSSAISSALKSASKCRECGSIGTTQTACSDCKKIAYCSVCEGEIYSLRIKEYSEWKHKEDGIPLPDQRLCQKCYSRCIEERYEKCSVCSLYYGNSHVGNELCPHCSRFGLNAKLFD